MIPENVDFWENWNNYVSKVNFARVHEPGGQCRIDLAFSDELKCFINDALGILIPKYRGVVRLRFGLEDGVFWTFEEIANGYGLTIERIRQIFYSSIRRIRGANKCKYIRPNRDVILSSARERVNA